MKKYEYQLTPTMKLTSDKMILAANMWKSSEGRYIILMLHPNDEYTMETAHHPTDTGHDELLDEHIESIKMWFKIEKEKIVAMLEGC